MDSGYLVEIRDESTEDEYRYQLYVDCCRRGLVTMGKKDRRVKMHWQTAGPMDFGESKVWIHGLLELYMIAEQLKGLERNEKG